MTSSSEPGLTPEEERLWYERSQAEFDSWQLREIREKLKWTVVSLLVVAVGAFVIALTDSESSLRKLAEVVLAFGILPLLISGEMALTAYHRRIDWEASSPLKGLFEAEVHWLPQPKWFGFLVLTAFLMVVPTIALVLEEIGRGWSGPPTTIAALLVLGAGITTLRALWAFLTRNKPRPPRHPWSPW